MKLYYNLSEINPEIPKIVSIGVFDGVHKGHLSIIKSLQTVAKANGGESYLITFEPHPRIVLGQSDFKLLTLKEEKIYLLERSGLDNLVILPFTKDVSELSAKQFIVDVLLQKLQMKTLVLGYDNQFGKNREGTYEVISTWNQSANFELIQLEEHTNDAGKISSTQIRNHLEAGEIELAIQKLGYAYSLTGIVIEGKKIGRTIGIPTANLSINNTKLLPKIGSYIVSVLYENTSYKGMLNIGRNPTIGNESQSVEVYILDFNEDIYGKSLEVSILQFLRDEQKFNSIEELKTQLHNDVEKTRLFFQ